MKSGLRCVLNKNHDGRHKFTPSHLLSPFTIRRILLELTTGEINSMAGLDNTYVLKGFENFQNMRSLVTTLAGFNQGEVATNLSAEIQKDIDWVEDFQKVDFTRHLGKGKSKCTCIECGFRDEKKDPIKCSCRDSHLPPCQDCQKIFQVSAF